MQNLHTVRIEHVMHIHTASVRLLPTENLWSASRVIRGLGMVVMGSQWCQGVPPTPANAFLLRGAAAAGARGARRANLAPNGETFANIQIFRPGLRTLH